MKCKYCNIEIKNGSGLCPLCHEDMNTQGTEEKLPQGFPPTAKAKPGLRARVAVTVSYLFAVSVIFGVCLIVNLLIQPEFLWSILVGAVLYYGLFLLKNTLFSTLSTGLRIFWQMVYLTAVMFLFEWILGVKPFVFDYGLPIICFIGVATMWIYVAARRFIRKYVVSLIMISAFGFLPVILYASNVAEIMWPSVTCAAASVAAILFTLIFGRKYIAGEFSKRFHI